MSVRGFSVELYICTLYADVYLKFGKDKNCHNDFRYLHLRDYYFCFSIGT